jgi:serine/threonine protein kinase/tetratricopeptide (TPR) repeat protein
MKDKAQEIFEQALAVAPERRGALIDEACGGNSPLRDEVLSLLSDAEAADDFFEALDQAVFSSPALSEEPGAEPPLPAEFSEGEIVGHYEIVSLIGYGGMGTVFRARDSRLNRDVALKFLASHLRAEPDEQERLLAEARAAASLDHPNVCSIHEVGETGDGRPFIAMPYYEGETLKARLRRAPLTTDEAVSFALQIARGLRAAHARGLIHRDVKPGNVMILSDGSVRLLDFGLAVPATDRLSRPGITPGTVAYMSPEQMRGNTLDARTDLWSLGVVLYEMIARIRPFKAGNHRALIQSILHDDATPLAKICPDVQPSLAAVVEKLLSKDPDLRYGDAGSLVTDLERQLPSAAPAARRSWRNPALAGSLVVAVAVVAGVLGWRSLRESNAYQVRALRAMPSIAVLPLTNLGGDSTDAALATGITEDLIATLSRAGDVRVIASTSVASLKRQDMDVRQIAESLGVTNILEGGIQKNGPHVRVQVRLIDGQAGTTRWSQSYEREFVDLFAVQDAIVGAVAAELELRFDKDRQFSRHRTRNMAAYELYLRGSDPVLLRSQSGIWRSQEYFHRAIAADPTYAAAHAGLALSHVRRARNASDPGMPVPRLLALAKDEARKAIALDSTLAEGHYALGRVQEASLEFPAAEASLQRAIELDPNRSVYRRSLSYLKAWTGQPEDELREARRALETDPVNPYALAAVASGYYATGRYGEATTQLEKIAGLKPPLQGVMFALAQCYAKQEMWDKAIATLRPGAEAGDPLFTALLGHMLARTGKTDEANRILTDVLARRERTGVGAFHVAIVHAGLGDLDETFAWLNRSVDDRSIGSFIMGPTFEHLRKDSRFDLLRKRLGLMS